MKRTGLNGFEFSIRYLSISSDAFIGDESKNSILGKGLMLYYLYIVITIFYENDI